MLGNPIIFVSNMNTEQRLTRRMKLDPDEHLEGLRGAESSVPLPHLFNPYLRAGCKRDVRFPGIPRCPRSCCSNVPCSFYFSPTSTTSHTDKSQKRTRRREPSQTPTSTTTERSRRKMIRDTAGGDSRDLSSGRSSSRRDCSCT